MNALTQITATTLDDLLARADSTFETDVGYDLNAKLLFTHSREWDEDDYGRRYINVNAKLIGAVIADPAEILAPIILDAAGCVDRWTEDMVTWLEADEGERA